MRARDRLLKFVLLVGIFAAGIGLGMLLWNRINLPFSNPWHVTGPLTELEYNPLNNIVRFLVLILTPAALLFLLYFLNIGNLNRICFSHSPPAGERLRRNGSPPEASTRTKIVLGVLLVLFLLVVALNFPVHPDLPILDTFHDGEVLGAGECYAEGQVPYDDFIFVHGLYKDPVGTVLAFKIFGRSIGAVRTLNSINKIIAFLLLGLLFYLLFERRFLYCFLGLLVLFYLLGRFGGPFRSSLVANIWPRDMTILSFLIVLVLMYEYVRQRREGRARLFVLCFLFAFIPLASFAYSVDRGFYLFATFLVLLTIIYFLYFHRNPLRMTFLISVMLGLGSAFLLLGVLLRWSYGEFFDFVFLTMPRYKELMDGYVYPIWDMAGFRICLIIAANTFWVAFRFLGELQARQRRLRLAFRSFIDRYLIEFSLLILSIFVFRSALGRASYGHITYSSAVACVLSILILFKHYLAGYLERPDYMVFKRAFTALLVVVLLTLSGFQLYRVADENLLAENFPLKVSDDEFIPENYYGTISFLKKNLAEDEQFVTLTNEGVWYYFVERGCPTRFPVVWFAMPDFYQREFVRDMEENNVKYVIYKNDSGANRIDGFENENRLPIIFSYVRNNYDYLGDIDDNEIWIRKGSDEASREG